MPPIPDPLVGTINDDVLNGDEGVNNIEALAGSDTVRTFGSGDNVSLGADTDADVLQGSDSDFDGDTVADFGAEDTLEFLTLHKNISREMSRLSSTESTVFTLQNGQPTGEGPSLTFTLTGDYSLGAFFGTHDGMGGWEVGFLQALPELSDEVTLDESDINGIPNQTILVGDGYADYTVDLMSNAAADYENTLGVYEIDGLGNIVDVRLLFNDVTDVSSTSASITGVEDGNQLGFFIVADGASWANALEVSDLLSFINEDDDPADVEDAGSLYLAVNGVASDTIVFHSFSATFNLYGEEHVVSGYNLADLDDDEGNEIDGLVIGFEDQSGEDNDFQDVVFHVSTEDAFVFIPTTMAPPPDEAESFF